MLFVGHKAGSDYYFLKLYIWKRKLALSTSHPGPPIISVHSLKAVTFQLPARSIVLP